MNIPQEIANLIARLVIEAEMLRLRVAQLEAEVATKGREGERADPVA